MPHTRGLGEQERTAVEVGQEGESNIIVSSVVPLLQGEDWKVRTLAAEALPQVAQTDCEPVICALLTVLKSYNKMHG